MKLTENNLKILTKPIPWETKGAKGVQNIQVKKKLSKKRKSKRFGWDYNLVTKRKILQKVTKNLCWSKKMRTERTFHPSPNAFNVVGPTSNRVNKLQRRRFAFYLPKKFTYNFFVVFTTFCLGPKILKIFFKYFELLQNMILFD